MGEGSHSERNYGDFLKYLITKRPKKTLNDVIMHRNSKTMHSDFYLIWYVCGSCNIENWDWFLFNTPKKINIKFNPIYIIDRLCEIYCY